MVTTATPEAWYDIAVDIKDCVEDLLNEAVLRSCVITGEIAWDDCECGQLVVALTRLYTSNNFPNEGPGAGADAPCGVGVIAADITVSILRCSPVGDEDGKPPSCAELEDAALQSVQDAWAVTTGLRCCLADWYNDRAISNYQVNDTTFVGAQGMCQGSNTLVNVGLINGCLPCGSNGTS